MRAIFCRVVVTKLKRDISHLGLRGKEMNLNSGNNEKIDIIKVCVYGIKAKAFEGIVAYYYFKESNTEYYVCMGSLTM